MTGVDAPMADAAGVAPDNVQAAMDAAAHGSPDLKAALDSLGGSPEDIAKALAAMQAASPQELGYVGIDLGVSCVTASAPTADKYAVTINTNDVSGRTTPATVSYDDKLRHIGVAADGRLTSAPKQTMTHLPLLLGGAELINQRMERYNWLFPTQEDGSLGPVSYNGQDFSTPPCGPLSSLLQVLVSYATGNMTAKPKELCIAIADYLGDVEVAAVRDALRLGGLEAATLLRHSDAVATAFAHSCGSTVVPEGASERVVGFVDIGVSQGTVSIVQYTQPEGQEEATAEFLFRKSDEAFGVQGIVGLFLVEVKSRIEEKHKCTVNLRNKAGKRLAVEAVHCMKSLSMLPEAEFALEAFQPEGSDGPELDVSLKLTRVILETAAAASFTRLKEVLTEAIAVVPAESKLEGVELVGGGSRIPAVQALIKEIAGEEMPLRNRLDGSSCIAVGATAWAAGRRVVAAIPKPEISVGLSAEKLEEVREREAKIEAVHCLEVKRLDKQNQLESYVYKVRGWLSGPGGDLLKPAVVGEYLDKVQLWFEDAAYAEEPTSYDDYAAKLTEVEEFVKTEGSAFFEKKKKDRQEEEAALTKASEEERERRKELGMDFDKDERHMKKEKRLELGGKNKDEGNDMFKAKKYDDAIRRYKKAIDHVSRPEAVASMTPDEIETANKIKMSCNLNSAQCYIKGAEQAFETGGMNGAEPFYKKARTACDDVLELDPENIKALFRRSLCSEKSGDLDAALKDIKKGLKLDPENVDFKRSSERLDKLLKKQKDGQKKVYGKMFG